MNNLTDLHTDCETKAYDSRTELHPSSIGMTGVIQFKICSTYYSLKK